MNDKIIFIWQWKFLLCVAGGFILLTTGNADEVNTRQTDSNNAPRSCAASLSTQKAKKPVPVKQTVFSQRQKGQLFKRGTQKRKTNCYISPKSANKQFAAKTAFLIDLRESKAFQRYRISGSLNISAHTLKTKSFLKSKYLILFNEGHSYLMLEKLCTTLPEAGFRKVSILAGGLNQWQKQIGVLQGDLLAQHALNKIPPPLFWKERDYEHWLVVNISPPDDKQRLSSDVLNLSPSDKGKAFVKSLTAAVAKRVSPYILIVSARGEHYLKVQAMLRDTDLNHVFYFQGGIYAYQQFIDQQAMMR